MIMKADSKLEELPLADPDVDHVFPKKRTSHRQLVLVCLFTTIFWWLFFTFQHSAIWTPKPATRRLTCGNTVEEARSLECVFDVLVFIWMPAECYDAEMDLKYRRSVHWHGYANPNGTQQLSLEAMSERTGKMTY
jgi:hypothetical protein